MQDPALAPDQGAANAKVGFEAWLSGLFEEDHTVSDADQTQDSKARRLSLGGTSAQIMRGNKIANGKLLRRRRELPAARQKQVVVANPYLDSEPTITTSRTNDTEDKASENLDKIRMRWDSQRKLSISTVRTDTCTLSTTANFSNYGYGSQYFPLSAKRPSSSHAPVTKAEAFTRLEPGSMLWPLIADSVGALCARSLPADLPPDHPWTPELWQVLCMPCMAATYVRTMCMSWQQTYEQSGWHLLQVKAFKLEEEGIMSTEEAKRRSHGTLVPIVRPLVRPKRKRIVTRDQDPQATVKNTLRKCAGDLCGGKLAVSRSSKPVAKREIFLERASQRAWDEARALGTATRKPVYDTDELFAWLAEDEQKNQNQLVRVCETCYEGYRALAAIREEGKSHGTGQRSGSVTLAGKHSGGHAVHTGEKAQKACLRLYEQFEEQARKKTLGVAKAMLEVQAREAKQANERRRLRRKRRPKRQSTSIQDASSSRQLSREGIHDSIDEGVKHAHEVSDARWETDSEWSGISLCPGDRVRDTDLREGTVVEVHEADDTCTVQFDMERIEARVSVSVLSHADIPQDTEFLQLSAADLIGVGPLPPLKKKNQRRPRRLRHSRTKTNTRSRVGLDATGPVKKGVYLSSNQDEDGEDEEDLYHAGVDEENDDADNDDADNDEKSEPENGDDADEIDPVTGVSKSFRDLFVTDDQVPASDADPEKSHTPLYYRHQLESEADNARLYGQGVHHMY
ncbi:Hypothetical Protein FCC1311_006982 [Hondaea fermentalgiana]|uniref:Uncharacterized protein n=1 Tax=Hondaea fermentalgiana TaxID=2315210 RepID=A0A2R5G0F8_9STRA|nr:Hypothetical Protein FCC1311_006982 [Hondaea fermentalgiana]|eukprot:GBG24480.1 Hypothetical Protein FCC1311_006982 [Hondaea fermentalgiana]